MFVKLHTTKHDHRGDHKKRKPFQNLKNVFKSVTRLQLKKPISKTKNKMISPIVVPKFFLKKKPGQMRYEFEEDIFRYLHKKEEKQGLPANLWMGTVVSRENRSRLVDWMMRVGQFGLEQETVELAVALVDHSLKLVSNVRAELQTLGVAALLLARKYEEVDFHTDELMAACPQIKPKEILVMEARLLSQMHFSLGLVLPVHFLKHLSLPTSVLDLTAFLSNVGLYTPVPLSPSQLAEAALFLSTTLLDSSPEEKMEDVNEEHVSLLAKATLTVHQSEKNLAFKENYKKKGGELSETMIERLEDIASRPL